MTLIRSAQTVKTGGLLKSDSLREDVDGGHLPAKRLIRVRVITTTDKATVEMLVRVHKP